MPSPPKTPSDRFQAVLRKGRAVAEAEKSPDSRDLEEAKAYDKEKRKLDLDNERNFLELRKKYGRGVLRFMWIYATIALTILIFDAFKIWGFDLPDSVLVSIVGGTAVSVLGVVGTIAAGLFKVRSD